MEHVLSPRIKVRLFGPLEVASPTPDGWEEVNRKLWGAGTPPRSALKRLLTVPERRMARSDIQDALWPHVSVELANRYLNDSTLVLRKVLGADLLQTIGPFYQIAGQAIVWTDLDACYSLVREAENLGKTTRQATSLLEEAHGYFTRGLCLEDESEQWSHRVRADAERMQRQVCTWLAEAYENQGLYWQAGEIYREMVRDLNEDALRAWLELLMRQGKTQEALSLLAEAQNAWRAQGITLSPSLHEGLRPVEPRLVVSEEIEPRWLPETRLVVSEREALVDNTPLLLYDGMEVEIMAMVLHWRRSSGPIAVLQRLTSDAIKKYDMSKDQHHHDTQITRRQALQTIAFFPIQMYGLSYLAPPSRPIPLDETLACCAAGITACWELRDYEPEGLQAIQRILSCYLPTLEHLAHQPSPFQQSAASLAAQGYLLVGILANHYSKLDQMELASRRAYVYGQLASDPNLQVSALIRLAVKLDFDEQDQQTLATYQQALALPDFASVTPLLQGRVYAGLAGMLGYCQEPDQALSYLAQAKEVFPADPSADPAHPIAICDTNSLVLWEGLTLQYVGRLREATETFARVGSLHPVPGVLETHRAENLNYAASLAIQQRDLDASVLYLETADGIAHAIKHAHLQEEVRATLKSLRLVWPHETQVQQLQAHMVERQHA